MELVLPNNYVALEQEEMMYLDGEGWIANSFAAGGAFAGSVAWAIVGAAKGGVIGTVTLPGIGTFSAAAVGAIAGAAYGFLSGAWAGYKLGRLIETQLLGWR